MIGVAAILAALSAEALAAWVVSTWTAAGFDEASGYGAVSFVTFLVVMHAAYWLPRTVEVLAIPAGRAYVLIAAVAFLVLYGAFRIEFASDLRLWDFGWVVDFAADREAIRDGAGPVLVGSFLIVATWVRGAWRATDDIELEEIPRRLAVPFGGVLIVCILGAWSGETASIARAAIIFFAVGVGALALSQSALSGATIGAVRSGSITGVLLAATAGVTVLGVIVFWVVFGLLGSAIGNVAGDIMLAVVTAVLTPVVWAVEGIMNFLLGGGTSGESPQAPAGLEGMPESDQDSQSGGIPEEVTFAWRLLLLLGLAGGAVAAIILVTHLRRRGKSRRATPANVDSAGSLGSDLRSLFGNLFGRGSSGQPVSGEGAVRLYTEMLREAEHRGQARNPGQTPVELLPSLTRQFPRAPVDEITRVFDDARYGAHEPDPAALEELRRRWEAGQQTE